jgi:hypothetical protein
VTIDPAVSWIVTLGSALLFGAAAAHKLADPRRFRDALGNYRLVPGSLVPITALIVIGLEVAATVLVFTPLRPTGATIGAVLLLIYACAIAVNLARGRASIDCGCLGAGRRAPISRWLVGRNLALAATVLLAAAPRGSRPLVALDFVTIACALSCIVALYSAQGVLSRPRPLAR